MKKLSINNFINKLLKLPFKWITKKFTKKFGSKVINRQYFHRKTGLETPLSLNHTWQTFRGKLLQCTTNVHTS